MTTSARWAKVVLLVSAILSFLLSLTALVAWHSGHWTLVRILPTLPIFPYLVYVNLLVLSTGLLLIALGQAKLAMPGGIICFGFGAYCFIQQVLNLNPGSLYLWFSSHIPARITQLTRVSPNTAVCFILSGLAVCLISAKPVSWLKKFRPAILGITGAALFTIGCFAIISSLSWMASLETWSRFAERSLHVPALLLFIGAAILAFGWNDREESATELPNWMPIPIGIAVLVATLILWESLTAHEAILIDQTINLQAATVRNEITSRIDFSTQALDKMTKRWESWKNPTPEVVKSDVGSFLNLFTGCITLERLDTALNSKWSVFFRNSKPNTLVQKQIKAILLDPKIISMTSRLETEKMIQMINLDSNEKGFLIFYPVFRDNKFSGFIYALFRCDAFLENILSDNIAPGYSIRVSDTEKELYKRNILEPISDKYASEWTKEIKTSVGPSIWRIQVCPSPSVLKKMGSSIPEFALVGGIILAILFTVVIHLGQTAHSRSIALRIANHDLEKEIKERKHIEGQLEEARDAALESARLKAEFVANMSHEIRTPMNGIIGMTGLLLETELSTKQKEFASMIRSSSEALLTIINDILDFSKIEAGKLTFEKLDFELNTVVDGVLDVFTGAIASKKIDLAAWVDPNIPQKLRGDPGRLRQVLTNLVGNAVKFTSHGEVLVEVFKEKETESDTVIRFVISDSGIGISPKLKGRLFQSFSQLDNSTTRKYGGTGLGLAISKQLIKQMEGEIDFKSSPGKGSQFWFTVKLEKQTNQTMDAHELNLLEKKRILLIEDNPKCSELLHRQLKEWKMECDVCDSMNSATAKLSELLNYDLVLVDFEIDLSNSSPFIKEIKSKPARKRPRLIGMSTSPNDTDRVDIKALGISRIVSKPVKLTQLGHHLIAAIKGEEEDSEVEVLPTSEEQDLFTEKTNQRKHFRILVVEDNVVNQKVALRQLEKLGYIADAVSNGIEALKNLENIPYDIILMDCQMAEMDGYQTAREIRKIEGNSRHTPIIAMTAHVLEGDREKCIAAGMDDYLSKPVDTDALKTALEQWSPRKSRATRKKASPAPTPPAHHPVERLVDIQRLREISNNDPAEMKSMLQLYLTQTTEILHDVSSALETKNFEQLAQLAHKGSGSSSQCGMLTLAPLFLNLEQSGRTNSWEQNQSLCQQLQSEFVRVKDFIIRDFQLGTQPTTTA